MHVRKGMDVGVRVESGERIDVIGVRAGASAGATIGVDDCLKDERRVGGGGVEERLPAIIARVDIERDKGETGIDHNGEEES